MSVGVSVCIQLVRLFACAYSCVLSPLRTHSSFFFTSASVHGYRVCRRPRKTKLVSMNDYLLEKFVSPFTSYHTHTRTFLFYLLYLRYFFLSPYLTLKENHMIATKISPCMCCKFTPSDGKTAKLPLKVKHLRRFLSSSLFFFFWRGRGDESLQLTTTTSVQHSLRLKPSSVQLDGSRAVREVCLLL